MLIQVYTPNLGNTKRIKTNHRTNNNMMKKLPLLIRPLSSSQLGYSTASKILSTKRASGWAPTKLVVSLMTTMGTPRT